MESLQEAARLAQGLEASGRGSSATRFELTRALYAQGVERGASRRAEAIELNDRATAILQALVDANPGVDDFQESLVWALNHQGILSSNPVAALDAYARQLALSAKLANAKPDAGAFQDIVAITHHNIVGQLGGMGRLSEALASRRRALAIWQSAADANPPVTILQSNVAFGLNNIGSVLVDLGRPAAALAA